MGKFGSICTCIDSSKFDSDANTCSCSMTQNSVDEKEVTTSSGTTHQISLLRAGDPTEGSRGSSCGSREFFFPMVSEGSHVDRNKRRRELPLYQKVLQSGNTYFQGALVNSFEGTRYSSSRSLMDERPMEHFGNPSCGTEGSHGGQNSQGSEHFRWKDDPSLASRCIERSKTSHDTTWSSLQDTRESIPQESWSSRSQSGSFADVQDEQSKSSGRERRRDADAGPELTLSGSIGVAGRDEVSARHEKVRIVVEENSAGGNETRRKLVERSWLRETVTDPIPQMAQKLQEAPDGSLESLRICLRDILESRKRKHEFLSLQRVLQRRSDLTMDSLVGAHRTQLEILVALKTGIPAFLHPDVALTAAALAEILLGTKCRNVGCQNALPADDCECKVCSSKWGFCNACMCVVCSKFDFDANTCRWIGCDFCLHWCHADCGIQTGHISSGKSTTGRTSGESVMQFRCTGCGHTSELYGFVEEVFTACAKDWPADVLARELQWIRKIFHRSEDLRGKQLFGKAEQLLVKLDSSRDVDAVWQSMMKFFAAGQREAPALQAASGVQVVRDVIPLPQERDMTSIRLADSNGGNTHAAKTPSLGCAADSERELGASFGSSGHEGGESGPEAVELLRERAWQKAQLKELENILQIKKAEAELFQMRADEVSREAEGLQRIVQAKIQKFDEEYKHKLLKLCVSSNLNREGAMGIRL